MTQSDWDGMESLLAEDIECSYSDGKYTFSGRNELMQFLRASHDQATVEGLSYWHVQMPEIEFQSDSEATGIWAMYHFNMNKTENQQLEMFSYYSDQYVKINDEWKIKVTGYQRIMEQEMNRNDIESLKLTVG